MARVKGGVVSHRRHKKVLESAKGYYSASSRSYRVAKQAVLKAGQHAYRGRKQKKRDYRSLWIVRINAAARLVGLTYSQLMNGLKKANIGVDRRMLAYLAVSNQNAFNAFAEKAKAVLAELPSTQE